MKKNKKLLDPGVDSFFSKKGNEPFLFPVPNKLYLGKQEIANAYFSDSLNGSGKNV
jgi:hypothetical protein